MASVEKRGNSWRVVFRWKGEKRSYTLGEVSTVKAIAHKGAVEELLSFLKRHTFDLRGHTIENYLLYEGHPPDGVKEDGDKHGDTPRYTLDRLRADYLASARRRLGAETARVAGYHLSHLIGVLDKEQPLELLDRNDLQRYVEERSRRNIVPSTIRNEIKTFRTAWNWARRFAGLTGEFPGRDLWYPKHVEPLPFMTMDEARRRVEAGEDEEAVWDSVYLRPAEIEALLERVKGQKLPPWVYVLFVFAAHTGARRSEMLRSTPADVDLAGGVVLLREMKRDVTKYTFRHVPITPLLREVLADWMRRRPRGRFLFASTQPRAKEHLEGSSVRDYFHFALEDSPWKHLRGWHVFRHSFISALAAEGVDQRIIDDLVGHSTEEQRRRYRHLVPDVKQHAVLQVFGAPKDGATAGGSSPAAS